MRRHGFKSVRVGESRRRIERSRIALLAAASLSLALAFAAGPAAAQTRVDVGTLICTAGPTIGALIGSRRTLTCHFNPVSGVTQHYRGTLTRFGLDVGATAGGIMSWRVLARTRTIGPGTIAGHYVGVSADASLGLGGGAKVLLGGSRRSTMLQPFALVGNIGLNLAVGVTGLTLRYVN